MTSTAAANGERLHLPALTGLRWFAALAVFLHHSARHDSLPGPISRIMQSGSNGVTFFFVLSGFVIALNYFDKAARPTFRNTWNYAVGRLARVYPLYLLVLVVLWLVLDHPGIGLLRFFLQLVAVQAWHPSLAVAYGLNPPGWSIGVEFFLYACFPLVVPALRPIAGRPRALLAVAVAVFLGVLAAALWFQNFRLGLPPSDPTSAHRLLYRTPATRLGDFTLGMVAALLLRHLRRTWTPPPRLSALFTWLPVAATLLLMAWPDRSRYYASLDAMWMLPAATLFLGLGLYPQSTLSRLLSARPIVFLGEVSFAFYLVHRPLMHLFTSDSWGADRFILYLAKMPALIALIIAVAAACHYFWERPAQRLVNKLLRLNTRPTQAPTPPAQRQSETAATTPAPEPAT